MYVCMYVQVVLRFCRFVGCIDWSDQLESRDLVTRDDEYLVSMTIVLTLIDSA
jgi:hypothetical protein